MKKSLTVEIELFGDGAVREVEPGRFEGGVPDPKLDGEVEFRVFRTELDENGIWNPVPEERPLESGLQISVSATSQGYREMAKYLLALAELDTSADPDFHDHLDHLLSKDKKTRLHLIFRRRSKGAV